MHEIFRMAVSMSLSGAALIAALLFGGRFLKEKLSRQWQYYIWMIVILRLLLPFGPEVSLVGRAYQSVDRAIDRMGRQTGRVSEQSLGQSFEQSAAQKAVQESPHFAVNVTDRQEEAFTENEEAIITDSQGTAVKADNREEVLKSGFSFYEGAALAEKYLWVIWLTVALGMMIRKISMYRSYTKYVKAGAEQVCDVLLLDRLAEMTTLAGIRRAVELCENPMISSPMLVGYLRPCIVLPRADIDEKEFRYIVMHELIHYRRRDIFYKWLVQLTVSLHWFNPFVYLMSRDIDRACEFSCDEGVVAKMGYDHAADYGETLLNAMAAVGTYREPLAILTMSANKELLKERLCAIMSGKKKTKSMGMITAGLTACIALGAFFLGVYPAAAAGHDRIEAVTPPDRAEGLEAGNCETAVLSVSDKAPGAAVGGEVPAKELADDAERYYKARSLPMFHIAFGELDEKEQESWLDRLYEEGEIEFFSVSVWRLDADSPLVQSFAEKFYEDGSIAFFSVLAKEVMNEVMLEQWLDQASKDQKWNFQSVLYDELDREEEKDELEKTMEEEQREAYRAVGVTWNGKNCYYKEQLVRIFLDIHMPNRSFYTLDMNPAGVVDIKIIRAEGGKITGVAYMSETETEELFGELYGDTQDQSVQEEEAFPQEMVVNMLVCNIRDGAGEEFRVVGLIGEGERVTVLGKKEGDDGRMWYLLDRESLAEQPDDSVKACYIRADLLQKE